MGKEIPLKSQMHNLASLQMMLLVQIIACTLQVSFAAVYGNIVGERSMITG